MKKVRTSKGITLIALIITVIVMIILAGVGLNFALGEGGIFRKADEGAQIYINAAGDEANALNDVDSQMGSLIDKVKQNPMEIVDVISTMYQKEVYVLTASGEVRLANLQQGKVFTKVGAGEKILTKDGIRKRGETYFIDNKGKVYTWGNNEHGQLGNGTRENSSTPICISELEGNVLKGKNIVEIYNLEYVSIVKDSEGKIYQIAQQVACLNDTENSPIKDKKIEEIFQIAVELLIYKDSQNHYYTNQGDMEQLVGSGTQASSVLEEIARICVNKGIEETMGTLIRDKEGTIYEVKQNIENKNYYLEIKLKNVVNMWTCEYFTSKNCIKIAIDKEGKVYTWGENEYGQLGNGTTEDSDTPICISELEGSALNNKKITDIYLHGSHYDTVIAKDSEGKVYAWGNNEGGQLGNGTTENSDTPICISELEESDLKGEKVKKIVQVNHKVIIYITEKNVYGIFNDYEPQ